MGDALGFEFHSDVQVAFRIIVNVALASVKQERTFNVGPGAIDLELFEFFLEILQRVWRVLWPNDVEAYTELVNYSTTWSRLGCVCDGGASGPGKGFDLPAMYGPIVRSFFISRHSFSDSFTNAALKERGVQYMTLRPPNPLFVSFALNFLTSSMINNMISKLFICKSGLLVL